MFITINRKKIDKEYLTYEDNEKRLNQINFRDEIINNYSKCIITNNECLDELEACHIIELNNGGTYDINNGLLIEKNLHATFDKYLWCINPDTLKIEVKEGHYGSIKKYEGKMVNITMNPYLYINMLNRYQLFL